MDCVVHGVAKSRTGLSDFYSLSFLDKSFAPCGVSGVTQTMQLKKFPDIPVSTQEEALESRTHPEEPRFRLLA